MIFRIEKNKNYTTMSNLHLKDKNLSLKAKGLLSMMLSLPNDWDYSIQGLASICKENETAINSTLKELKEMGYLYIHKNNPTKENGGKVNYEYFVFEKSMSKEELIKYLNNLGLSYNIATNKKQGANIQPLENQPLEVLGVETLPLENQRQLNNYNNNIINNNKELNTNILNTNKYNNTSNNIYSNNNNNNDNNSNVNERQELVKVVNDLVKDEELKDLIVEFIKMRKLMKKPLTEFALKRCINKLSKLSVNISKQKEIVIQSITNGWLDFYELKSTQTKTKNDSFSDYYQFSEEF